MIGDDADRMASKPGDRGTARPVLHVDAPVALTSKPGGCASKWRQVTALTVCFAQVAHRGSIELRVRSCNAPLRQRGFS